MKRNHAWKCADIDFSYKQDAKIVRFTANLRPFLKAPEQSENYTLFNWPFFFKSHMVKVAFEKQFIRKWVEHKPSSPFSAFCSLLFDNRFLISFQI